MTSSETQEICPSIASTQMLIKDKVEQKIVTPDGRLNVDITSLCYIPIS